jgi:hypothetical protein
MEGVAFVTVAFGDRRYIEQLERLKSSIYAIYPDANLFAWQDALPPGSKTMEASLYGFKVHAVKYALGEGYQKIIWIDPACILLKGVEYYFWNMPPVIAVMDDNLLEKHIADKALTYYGNPEIEGWHLVGGSLYVFDFEQKWCAPVFERWAIAERDGVFGSQVEASSEQINKHRSDESCMAMALYLEGQVPIRHDVARYCNGDMIWDKKHFKL